MKKYVEVFWAPAFFDDFYEIKEGLQLMSTEPKHLVQLVINERQGSDYIKCPAFIDRIKNTFVITAPFDFSVTVDVEKNTIATDRFGQKFFEDHVRLRNAKPNMPILISLPPAYVFYSNESVLMDVQDVPIICSQSSKNTRVIVGEYDIGSWTRPIDWTFELHNQSSVHMKRGDALFAIRFRSSDNRPIKLVRTELTKELMSKMYGCLHVKNYVKNLRLPTLYKMASGYLSSITKKK